MILDMDALVAVGLVALVFYAIYKSDSKPLSTSPQTLPNRHGHRCYISGLNDGERVVVGYLAKGLDSKNYFIFNNIVLPNPYNGSTQIDHIVVSRFGIFVIESKNMKGWIYGHEKEKKWTQTFRGNHKYPFQNPILQNEVHVRALRDLMPLIGDHIQNIVVFSTRSTIKKAMPPNVMHTDKLVDYIKSFTEPVLSENYLFMAIGKLSYMCQTVDITADQHIANVQAQLQIQKAA